jgi:hypothetical protein
MPRKLSGKEYGLATRRMMKLKIATKKTQWLYIYKIVSGGAISTSPDLSAFDSTVPQTLRMRHHVSGCLNLLSKSGLPKPSLREIVEFGSMASDLVSRFSESQDRSSKEPLCPRPQRIPSSLGSNSLSIWAQKSDGINSAYRHGTWHWAPRHFLHGGHGKSSCNPKNLGKTSTLGYH